jgi:thiosulfate/3-mercaptopyruvate sulfurtransferase
VDAAKVLILDPRPPVRYLQGHVKNAVNLPRSRAFDVNGQLLSEEELGRELGAAGLDDSRTPVVYDAWDGRDGAMLTWILHYLGRTDARLMDVFFERWVAESREIFYRPVKPEPGTFIARINGAVRATLGEIRTGKGFELVDCRSPEEYSGQVGADDRPGRIPGAANVPWEQFLRGPNYGFVVDKNRIKDLLTSAGVGVDDSVVTYCRTGPRAAVAYVALQEAGYTARLYDRSYAEWAASGLPVESP